jgi:hypothetical protein
MHVDARISSGGQGGGNITENNGGANGGGLNGGQPQSFLDGHFAGGWQSNADLADRRRIIFSIIKVIERMRPDANRMSQKLVYLTCIAVFVNAINCVLTLT